MIRNLNVFGQSRRIVFSSALFVILVMVAGSVFGQEVDPGNSDIGAESYAAETGDTVVIFCILRDDTGNPIAGRDVEFFSDRIEDEIIDAVATSDSTGYAQARVTTDVEGETTVRAEAGPIGLGPADEAIVWTAPPPPDPVIGPDECEIGARAYTATVGDDITIFAVIRDTDGAPMAGVDVTFTPDRTEDIVATSTVTTGADGRAETTLSTTIEGVSIINVVADTIDLGSIDPIAWAMPIITRYVADYWNADGDIEQLVNVNLSNGTSSLDYYDVTELDLEVSEMNEYTISYTLDSTRLITNRHKLEIETGMARQLDYFAIDPWACIPREMPYTFFQNIGETEELVWDYIEPTLTLEGGIDKDIAFVIDEDLTEDMNYAISNVVSSDPDMLHKYLSWGKYFDGMHLGIWADVQLRDLDNFAVSFVEIPSYTVPVGITNAYREYNRPFDFGFDFPCQIREIGGDIHEAEYLFPQLAVRDGYYHLETMMDMDGYLDLALPIHVYEENPVIIDYYAFMNSEMIPYIAMKVAESYKDAGLVVEMMNDEVEMTVSASVMTPGERDWWVAFVLPFEYGVESIIAVDDVEGEMELVEFNDYAVNSCALFKIVTVRVEAGMTDITVNYRNAYEKNWELEIGWNMVSYPYLDMPAADEVFDAIPFDPFIFDNESGWYVAAEELEPEKGYFIYSREEGTYMPDLTIESIIESTMMLYPGWNLIGAPDRFFGVGHLLEYPEVIGPVYGFNAEAGVYQEAEMIEFGNAYWVLAADTVEVVLP